MMEKKRLAPKDANTFNKICKLQTDNIHTRLSWIMLNERGVTITNQKMGHSPTGSVTLTRKEFEKFIKFYLTEQPTRKK